MLSRSQAKLGITARIPSANESLYKERRDSLLLPNQIPIPSPFLSSLHLTESLAGHFRKRSPNILDGVVVERGGGGRRRGELQQKGGAFGQRGDVQTTSAFCHPSQYQHLLGFPSHCVLDFVFLLSSLFCRDLLGLVSALAVAAARNAL